MANEELYSIIQRVKNGEKAEDVLFDIIQAGLVEKVEEEN